MPRPKPPVPWRSRHPQLSVCLPVLAYARLFTQAKARNCSAAALARDLLVTALAAPDPTPAGQLPPRESPILDSSATAIPRHLPAFPGVPVGVQLKKLDLPPDEA